VGAWTGSKAGVHPSGQADRKRPHRKLQWPVSGREPDCPGFLLTRRGKTGCRGVEAGLQHVRLHTPLAGMSPEEYQRAVKGGNTEVATTNLSLAYLAG